MILWPWIHLSTVEMKRNTHCFSAKHPADVPICTDLYQTPCRCAHLHRPLPNTLHMCLSAQTSNKHPAHVPVCTDY